ncbi:MAG TPA: (Fe-S)-binding protein [Acidimicrobiales bacterium]|nr:(Fe-S)-binding protein [Acidimicrobiales bacterium]
MAPVPQARDMTLEDRARAAVADCVHCGFCLPACPTYVLWQREPDSPRGRIQLLDGWLRGRLVPDAEVAQRFDNCLGCLACVTACPSGVQYEHVIDFARGQLARKVGAGPNGRRGHERTVDWALRLFPYRGRLRIAALGLVAYRRSGVGTRLSRSRVWRQIPRPLREMAALAPGVGLGSLSSRVPRSRPSLPVRGRVVLLRGCVQAVFFPDVTAATVRVLNAEGFDVVVPSRQPCCGALAQHEGRRALAAKLARELVDTTPLDGIDAVVVNAAGCGSAMKRYGSLEVEPGDGGRAREFASRVRDLGEFLAAKGPRADYGPLPLRLAFHDACHLAHAQGVREEPRRVLSAIPGVQLLEVSEPELCCGSAGLYNLLEPEPAAELGRRKAATVLSTAPDVVVTSNPGCALQLARHLAAVKGSGPARRGSAEPVGASPVVLQLAQVLDRSLANAARAGPVGRLGRFGRFGRLGRAGPVDRAGPVGRFGRLGRAGPRKVGTGPGDV